VVEDSLELFLPLNRLLVQPRFLLVESGLYFIEARLDLDCVSTLVEGLGF
jgi:hypothetical protein